MIVQNNVKPTKPRGFGRSAGVRRATGKAGTVEKTRQTSPISKLCEKSQDQALRNNAAQHQHQKKSPAASSQKSGTRNFLGKRLQHESSPVAQFGAAALSGLGAASTACGGEGAVEAGERDPRTKRARKGGRDTSPTDPGPGAQNMSSTWRLRLLSLTPSRRPASCRDVFYTRYVSVL